MSRNKIISIVTSAIMASSLLIGATFTNTKTIHKNNVTLLSSTIRTSKTRSVVINSSKSPLVLYSNPNINSKVSSYISVGEILTINKTVGNYYYVTVQETGATGYISIDNAQIIKSGLNEKSTPINKSGFIINVSSVVYLRSQPTMDTNIIGNLLNSTNIDIISKQGDWYKVQTSIGTGYVYGEYVGISSNTILSGNTKDKIVATPTNATSLGKSTTNTQTYTTDNSDVVIKTSPDWNSKSLEILNHKSIPVKVISSDKNWDKIELPNKSIGYVPTGSIINGILSMNSSINSAISNTAKTAGSAVNTATSVGSGIASIIDSAANVVNTFNNNVNTTTTHAVNNIKNVNNNISANINSTANHAQNIGNNIAKTIKNTSDTINNASETADSISNTVADTAKNVSNTINNVNSNIKLTVDNAHQNIKNATNTVKTTNQNINNTIKDINNGINSNITSTANNINTVNDGVKSAADKVINGINNINQHIANLL